MSDKWKQIGDRFLVAGVVYSDYQQVLPKMKLGDQVRFIGEPHNEFDRLAIRIEWRGTKIGYVPARTTIQQLLWNKHKGGCAIVGVVTAISKNNPTHSMFTVMALATEEKKLTKQQGEVEFAKMRAKLSYQMR